MTQEPQVRELHGHQINALNRAIDIAAGTITGAGGAPLQYAIVVQSTKGTEPPVILAFQNGNPAEEINGLTNEALLVILIDRMQCFQSGPFKSRQNALALTHLEDALHWLQHRTREREARGVEGAQAP